VSATVDRFGIEGLLVALLRNWRFALVLGLTMVVNLTIGILAGCFASIVLQSEKRASASGVAKIDAGQRAEPVRRYHLDFPYDKQASMRNGSPIVGYNGCEEADAMDELVWEKISAAPYDRDLELAVIEGDHMYALVFACRRTASGWIKTPSMERVTISPTHWRIWSGTG